jgi:hypothetical protein
MASRYHFSENSKKAAFSATKNDAICGLDLQNFFVRNSSIFAPVLANPTKAKLASLVLYEGIGALLKRGRAAFA